MFGLFKKSEVTDIVAHEDLDKLTIRDLTDENDVVKALSVDQVFQIIKNSVKSTNETRLQAMLQSCEMLRDNLELTGQTNLLYQLTTRVRDIGKEFSIIEAGYKFYVYRKDINTIIKKVNEEKGFEYLRLDRLHDYMRLIPPQVAELIKSGKEIFEAMYILHIDPNGNQNREVEQVKKDRDPILFGVPSKKNEKMYLMASWEDSHCDYTLMELLDDMATKMENGNDALHLVDIPTTVDELVNNLAETTGIWNTYHGNEQWYRVANNYTTNIASSSGTLTTATNVITYNNFTVEFED